MDKVTTETELPERAGFASMATASPLDWKIVSREFKNHAVGLPDRVIDHLCMLKGDFGGFAVDRFEHSLQTATRAFRDGADEEMVVCALLHDIGDTLASWNHAELGATILKPFVSEQNHWLLQNHGIFQGYYFFHHLGMDRNLRDQFLGHPWFEHTASFCEKWDQTAFQTDYDTMPLEAFVPMVRRVMEKPKVSIYKEC